MQDKENKENSANPAPGEEITLDPGDGENPSTDLEFYVKTIEELRQERDQYYDLMLRKQAEFENYRKRVNREKAELRGASKAEVLRELLPVLDSAEKGLETLREIEPSPERDAFVEGYELLVKGLAGLLERFGVSEVAGVGEAFDPHFHEAVIREVGDHLEDGEILEEFRKGYEMNGRLLRPSQVKVAVQAKEASMDN